MSSKPTKPFCLSKRWHYNLASALLGILLVGSSIASTVCWLVIYRPFEKFVRIEMQAVYGENIVVLNHYDYVWYYKADGVVYEMHKRRGSGFSWPTKITFHYLDADPNYTIMNRNAMLIVLPVISFATILVYALIFRLIQREIQNLNRKNDRTFRRGRG